MNAKEEYWQRNLLQATVLHRGREFHVYHNMHDKKAKVLETGKYWSCGRREFRKWVKEHGGHICENLKTGEFYNIHTGKKEALWGINNNQ